LQGKSSGPRIFPSLLSWRKAEGKAGGSRFAKKSENTAKTKFREPDFQPKTPFYPVFVFIRFIG